MKEEEGATARLPVSPSEFRLPNSEFAREGLMHSRTAVLFLVLPVSCVVAALVLPADPWHWFLLTMAIFGVSVASISSASATGGRS